MKTLIIDNFDSFTYNIFQYCAELGGNPIVIRNDDISLSEIEKQNFTHIILSPGPGSPTNKKDFGICREVIKHLSDRIPILGICLGHQGIIAMMGGSVMQAPMPVHGKQSLMKLDTKNPLFFDLPSEIIGMRYHSLLGKKEDLPDCLKVIAETTEDGLIMGVSHNSRPLFGVQFHPESIGTPEGKRIIANFLNVKTAEEMEKQVNDMISGRYSEDTMMNMLRDLAERGETVEELMGAILALRKHAIKVPLSKNLSLMDTCGTGGSGLPRMNISTAVAFVLSAAGVSVAKHGNKASSGRFGSFDLLEALGINIHLSPKHVSKSLEKHHLAFIYAPDFHPAFRILGPVRKKLGIRTIFNLIGPLVNPTKPAYHLLGTTSKEAAKKLIEVMKRLQYKRAMVVVGEGGLDEITAHGQTSCYELRNGRVKTYTFTAEFSLEKGRNTTIPKLGTAECNTKLFIQLLEGTAEKSLQNLFEINSAFAFFISGKAKTIRGGLMLARKIIQGGGAMKKLTAYKQFSLQYS